MENVFNFQNSGQHFPLKCSDAYCVLANKQLDITRQIQNFVS
jgi:hypothetical protein